MTRWLLNGLKVADIALNWFPGMGREVETLSRRAAKARAKGKRWGCLFCAAVDWLALNLTGQSRHCARALEAEAVR